MKDISRLAVVWLCLLAWAPSAAEAVTIDFEGTGLAHGDLLTTQIPDLTFSGAVLTEEGGPALPNGGFGSAALPPNTVEPGQSPTFGGAFISLEDFVGPIDIRFVTPVFGLSFVLADLDAGETITAEAFDAADASLGLVMVGDGEPGTGDGILTEVSLLPGNISRVSITPNQPAGVGLDTLTFQPVPSPATGLLLGLGLAAMSGQRRIERRLGLETNRPSGRAGRPRASRSAS